MAENQFSGIAEYVVQTDHVDTIHIRRGVSRRTALSFIGVALAAAAGAGIWSVASDSDYEQALDELDDPDLGVRGEAVKKLGVIARERPGLHRPGMESLAAFIRKRSPAVLREDGLPVDQNKEPDKDVLDAVAVIGGRDVSHDNGLVLDLSGASLPGVQLQHAHLPNANFRKANLTGTRFEDAHLQGAVFEHACLNGAHLERAVAWGAQFPGANLWSAVLNETKLDGANMDGFIGLMEVKGTDLRKTENLPARGLAEPTEHARYISDDWTRWP
ncbi:pentapeptide repeat-containing protein [Lentzea tibetensis]|uniref:Pentapeptide repeat-containing protein n=1 Tax=Lentzea tibetensis TaxID=2591470 RepID=A0A563EZX4_9PSEU|nr:pentapeptide repeat-containing protein [Lentzea tibetensis]TWP53183.1 pentapeptide repeat-containing protein [Lentzea tibetensis]